MKATKIAGTAPAVERVPIVLKSAVGMAAGQLIFGGGGWFWPMVGVGIGIAIGATGMWLWRRHTPVRCTRCAGRTHHTGRRPRLLARWPGSGRTPAGRVRRTRATVHVPSAAGGT